VIAAQGGGAGGYVLYVKDSNLLYAHNYAGRDTFEVASAEALPEGRHALRFEFEPTGDPDIASGKGTPARLQLYVDGTLVGDTDAPYTTPLMFEIEGLSCGYDFAGPVLEGVYEPPFEFTGTIHKVTIDLSGELIQDDEATVQRMMAQQ
jgi:arylsulfatase